MSAFPALARTAVAVNVRQPATALFGFVMPLGIILVFQLVGGGLVDDGSIANQAVPGILAYSVANAALSASALTFTAWRSNGMLTRLRLEPISPGEIVTARFSVTAVITLLQALVFVALGAALLGLDVDTQFWTAGLGVVVLAAAVFFTVGAFVGLLARSEQAVSAGLNLILLPVAFLSGCFVPLSSLPEAVGDVVQLTPLAALSTGLIDATAGDLEATGLAWSIGVLAVWGVLAALVVARMFRRVRDT